MKKITDPAPESLMFKPVLIPPDATGEEADVCFTSSLVELYKASESIFEKLENRLNKCQERAENVYRRIDTINRKVQSLGTVENAKLTYPARYPDLRKSLLTAVFEKNDFDSYVQKPEDKVIFKEDPVSAQTLKEAVIRKKDFGYAFGSGKHLEILKSLKLDDSDAEGCDLIDEDYIYAEKGKRYFESEKYDLETDSLLIYDSVGKAFQGDPFAYKPELGALSVFDFPAVLPKLSGVKKPDLSDDWSLQSIAPSAQVSNTSGTEPQVDLSIPNNIYRRQKLPNQSVKQPESTAKAPEMDLPETISVSSSTPSLPSASLSTPNIPPKTPPSMPVKAPSPPPSFSSPMPQPTVATVSAAPPPPPPPPPPPIILPSLPELPKGRSDLMEAIRKAGGSKNAKLKSTNSSPATARPTSKPVNVADSSGEDLMSSLAKALEQRRKGIAGKTRSTLERLEAKKKATPGDAFLSMRDRIPVVKNDDGSDSGELWS